MLRDRELPERSRTTVQRMRDEVRTLLHMLLNLLDISRSDEGGLVARKEVIALQTMFDQVLHDFDLKAQAANITMAAASGGATVTGDSRLLLRVLRSLAAAGQLVVFSTHDIELAAQADRLILLGSSGIVASGAPQELLRQVGLWEQAGLRMPDWVQSTC